MTVIDQGLTKDEYKALTRHDADVADILNRGPAITAYLRANGEFIGPLMRLAHKLMPQCDETALTSIIPPEAVARSLHGTTSAFMAAGLYTGGGGIFLQPFLPDAYWTALSPFTVRRELDLILSSEPAGADENETTSVCIAQLMRFPQFRDTVARQFRHAVRNQLREGHLVGYRHAGEHPVGNMERLPRLLDMAAPYQELQKDLLQLVRDHIDAFPATSVHRRVHNITQIVQQLSERPEYMSVFTPAAVQRIGDMWRMSDECSGVLVALTGMFKAQPQLEQAAMRGAGLITSKAPLDLRPKPRR